MEDIMDSNMIPGVKTLKNIIYIFSALFLISGCDQIEDQKENVSQSVSPTTVNWVKQAVLIAEKIPIDLHRVEHDRSLSKIAVTAIDVGINDQSARILSSIDSWRKADLYARLARKHYAVGNITDGDKLIELSKAFIRENTCEDWQVSRVHLAIEQAEHLKGNKTKADVVRKMDPADQAELMPAVVDSRTNVSNIVDMLDEFEATTNKVHDMDTALGIVNSFLALYEKSQGSGNPEIMSLRERILQNINITFKGLPAAIACEKMVDFCNAALRSGDREFAMILSEDVEERLSQIRIDLRLPVQLKYAEFLCDVEKKENALKIVSSINSDVYDENLLFSDRPAILAHCAAIQRKCGDNQDSLQNFELAFKELSAMSNARPRAVAAVDVCLVAARSGFEDASLLAHMKELYSNLSDPW